MDLLRFGVLRLLFKAFITEWKAFFIGVVAVAKVVTIDANMVFAYCFVVAVVFKMVHKSPEVGGFRIVQRL